MDLRDLRYFETIAELAARRTCLGQAAPDAAGPDEQRAAPRGGLRRRPLRAGRPRHPPDRSREGAAQVGPANALRCRGREAGDRGDRRRARRPRPHRHRPDRGPVRVAGGRSATAARGSRGHLAHGRRSRRQPAAAAACRRDRHDGRHRDRDRGRLQVEAAGRRCHRGGSEREPRGLPRRPTDAQEPDGVSLGPTAPRRPDPRLARSRVRPQAPSASPGASRDRRCS